MRNNKGSLFLEYTFIILVVIAAWLSVGRYVKRAVFGRWRQVGDYYASGRQYEPGVTDGANTYNIIVSVDSLY